MLGRDAQGRHAEYDAWVKEARRFGKAIWDITGKQDIDIVFEHPGEATFPVSCLVVKRGGMVVFCAGTTGYNITFDARYVWMRQKRIQGSHFAHLKQASAANQFVIDRRIDPCMSDVFPWEKIPYAHELMRTNRHKPGNMAVLVNAPRTGLHTLEDVIEAASMPELSRQSAVRGMGRVAGWDAAGIVWAVGSKVRRWKVGDEVIVHCNQDDGDDEDCNGGDPLLSPSQRIWGYETPDGSFAQFCRVQSRQLMRKPPHLTWEESACYTLTLATAYRMLFGHPPHILKPGDNVLVWGASGGLGVFGIQLVAASGANAMASSPTNRKSNTCSISAPRASSTARNSSAGAPCRWSALRNTTPG